MDFLEKEERLPQPVKAFLRSNDSRLELRMACFLYGISQVSPIAGEIGLIFVGELKLRELPNIIAQNLKLHGGVPYGIAFELNKRLFHPFSQYFIDASELLAQWERVKSNPLISEQEASKKVLELEPWILEEAKEKAEEEKAQEERIRRTIAEAIDLTLTEAINKYPEIGEQLITSNAIKLKNFPEPVRPSFKNWLADYTLQLGYDYHDTLTRSHYLFQSENTRHLSADDHQKLATIINAFDEKTTIKINPTTKQIVFPVQKVELRKTVTPAAPSNVTNIQIVPAAQAKLSKRIEPIKRPQEKNERTESIKNFSPRPSQGIIKRELPSAQKSFHLESNNHVLKLSDREQETTHKRQATSNKRQNETNNERRTVINSQVSQFTDRQIGSNPQKDILATSDKRQATSDKILSSQQPAVNHADFPKPEPKANVEFSYPHKFPYEKKKEEQTAHRRSTPVSRNKEQEPEARNLPLRQAGKIQETRYKIPDMGTRDNLSAYPAAPARFAGTLARRVSEQETTPAPKPISAPIAKPQTTSIPITRPQLQPLRIHSHTQKEESPRDPSKQERPKNVVDLRE